MADTHQQAGVTPGELVREELDHVERALDASAPESPTAVHEAGRREGLEAALKAIQQNHDTTDDGQDTDEDHVEILNAEGDSE